MSDVDDPRARALRNLFLRHREQRMQGQTIGCSCGWCPATCLGPLLTQYADHLTRLVDRLLPMECSHRLGGLPDAPVCSRRDWHDPTASGGHVYESTSGVLHALKEEA